MGNFIVSLLTVARQLTKVKKTNQGFKKRKKKLTEVKIKKKKLTKVKKKLTKVHKNDFGRCQR